jgi:hypothetical protein
MKEQSISPAPPRNSVEYMATIAAPPGLVNTIRNLEQITRIVMSWSACTLDVFVRFEQGERYLTVGRVILGWLTIRFFLALANLQNSVSWMPGVPSTSEATINRWYLTCYLLLSAVHLCRIWQRNRAGVIWHSRSFGRSWLDFLTALPPLRLGRYELRVTEWMLYRFLEPLICFSAFYFLMPESFTRSWLLWASFTMLVHNNMIYTARRERFLDMIDGYIEGGYYNDLRSDALGQKSGTRQMGYVEMPLPSIPMPDRGKEVNFSATVAAAMGTKQLALDAVLNTKGEA